MNRFILKNTFIKKYTIFDKYFYKNKKFKLGFGDRVIVLNNFIYWYRGSIKQHNTPSILNYKTF